MFLKFFACFLLLILVVFAPARAEALHFLSIADIHYGPDNRPGDGHDTGDESWGAALKKFRQLSAQAEFIMVLGDLPTHTNWFSNNKAANEEKIFHDLYLNAVNTPIFYVPGNNDSLKGNYQPFSYEGHSPLDLAKDWQGACAYCDDLIVDGQFMSSGGYYAASPFKNNKDKALLVVLNSTQFTKIPLILPPYFNQNEDAQTQLDWLENLLQTFAGQQIYIAMHVEPGNDFHGNEIWHRDNLERFMAIIDNLPASTELSIFSAHSHYDEIRRMQTPQGRSVMIYGTPSISRDHHNNSGMKLFSVDDALNISNFTTFYTDQLSTWDEQSYQGQGGEQAIFSCTQSILDTCLKSLSIQDACAAMSAGNMYGVKNPRFSELNCSLMYLVS